MYEKLADINLSEEHLKIPKLFERSYLKQDVTFMNPVSVLRRNFNLVYFICPRNRLLKSNIAGPGGTAAKSASF